MNENVPHPPITTERIADVLEREFKAGNRKPPVFYSLYGVGKSSQIAEFCKRIDGHLVSYPCALKTYNDIRGFGVPDHETRKMAYFGDEDFDFVTDKVNVLDFDEIGNTAGQVKKSLMRIFLDRKIGKEPLPENTFITGTSNRLCHRTGVEPIPAALADRFSIYHVRPDFSSFMKYMEQNAKSAEVLAFLNVNSDSPYNFDVSKWDGESNMPTFRSFERLDELAASYRSTQEMAEDDLLPSMASSKVGGKYGPMFAQFVRLTNKIGDIDRMIDEADTCAIPAEADLRWIIACKLITSADKNRLAQVLTLAHRLSEPNEPDWTVNNDPSAMQTYVCTAIRRRRQELLRTAEMLDWQQKFAKTLTEV